GRLAATLLETLASLGTLPDRYSILEVSADLADRQRALLQKLPADLQARVVWLDRLPGKPLRGLILANEVLAARAFHRITLRDGAMRELGVTLEGEGFTECEQEPSEELARAWSSMVAELPVPLPDGYVSELCQRVEPWIAGVGDCLERGLFLLFDYGL